MMPFFLGELEELFSPDELLERATKCKLPSASLSNQEFTIRDIEACHHLKLVFSKKLAPYSHYYFGKKKGDDHLMKVGISCNSSKLKKELEQRRQWTSKFACFQDEATEFCNSKKSERVVREFLLSFFPAKSKYER